MLNEEMKHSKILAYITALKKLCNHPKVYISGEQVLSFLIYTFILLFTDQKKKKYQWRTVYSLRYTTLGKISLWNRDI